MFAMFTALACTGDGGDTGKSYAGGDATAGANVYETCARCHGDDGKLGVKIGGEPAADLSVEIPEKSDAELADIAQNGFGTMVGQGISDGDLPDLIAYLRATFP